MTRYYVEIFDSRNTSMIHDLYARNFTSAVTTARNISKNKKFPVIVKDALYRGQWAKFERGEKTEWSLSFSF